MADEFMELFGEWGQDLDGNPLPLTVETYRASGSMGPRFEAPADHPGLPRLGQNRLVRTPAGDEVLSSVVVYAPRELAGVFTLGSRVTLDTGRVAAVLTVATPDVYGLFGFVAVNVE